MALSEKTHESIRMLPVFVGRIRRCHTLLQNTPVGKDQSLLMHSLFADYLSIRDILGPAQAYECLRRIEGKATIWE